MKQSVPKTTTGQGEYEALVLASQAAAHLYLIAADFEVLKQRCLARRLAGQVRTCRSRRTGTARRLTEPRISGVAPVGYVLVTDRAAAVSVLLEQVPRLTARLSLYETADAARARLAAADEFLRQAFPAAGLDVQALPAERASVSL